MMAWGPHQTKRAVGLCLHNAGDRIADRAGCHEGALVGFSRDNRIGLDPASTGRSKLSHGRDIFAAMHPAELLSGGRFPGGLMAAVYEL
jgi:hypothetical protein